VFCPDSDLDLGKKGDPTMLEDVLNRSPRGFDEDNIDDEGYELEDDDDLLDDDDDFDDDDFDDDEYDDEEDDY